MPQRVLMGWFNMPGQGLRVPAPSRRGNHWCLIRDFLEEKGCIVEFVPPHSAPTDWDKRKQWSLKEYDIYIYVVDDIVAEMSTSLRCLALESEYLNGRPKVFKLWLDPEMAIRVAVHARRELQKTWPPGWFGPATEDELLFRRETMADSLNRLAELLKATTSVV